MAAPLISNANEPNSNYIKYDLILTNNNNKNILYNNKYVSVEFTTTKLSITELVGAHRCVLEIDSSDLIGGSIVMTKRNGFKLLLYYYPIFITRCSGLLTDLVSARDCNDTRCPKEDRCRVRKELMLDFLTNHSLCEQWLTAVRCLVYGQLSTFYNGGGSHQPLYLVVVNPVGGQGYGRSIWTNTVSKMLHEADIKVDLLITEYSNHAKNYVHQLNRGLYAAILCIGGDGMVFEVMNGIKSRSDCSEFFATVAIVHVPGGTGNGLAKSVLYASREKFGPLNATFVAIRGHPQPLDLSVVTTSDGVEHMSFLSLSWGLISDIDILSESMRCIGELRLYIAAVYFILMRRYCSGRLRMSLIDDDVVDGIGSTSKNIMIFDTEHASLTENKAINTNYNTDMNQNTTKWTVIEGRFLFVFVVQTSHVASTICCSPNIKLDDGIFTIFVAQEMTRYEMLTLLIELDSNGLTKHPKVKVYRCNQYTLEPTSEDGILSLDGEVIHYGDIQATVLPSAARVLVL